MLNNSLSLCVLTIGLFFLFLHYISVRFVFVRLSCTRGDFVMSPTLSYCICDCWLLGTPYIGSHSTSAIWSYCNKDMDGNSDVSTGCCSSSVHAGLQEDPLPVLFRRWGQSDLRSSNCTHLTEQMWLPHPAGDLWVLIAAKQQSRWWFIPAVAN